MRGPSLPSADDALTTWRRVLLLGSVWVSGWVVDHTVVPPEYRTAVGVGLVAVGFGGVVVVAQFTSLELTGGRCRAVTNDGYRCKHSRPPNRDFCPQVHERTHGVEYHPSVYDETVSPNAHADAADD
jgi:hypothetical protein